MRSNHNTSATQKNGPERWSRPSRALVKPPQGNGFERSSDNARIRSLRQALRHVLEYKNMSQIVKWPAGIGQFVDTELYPIGTHFHEVSGLYVMCKPTPDGKWQPLYVGQAVNLNQRVGSGISNHHAVHKATAMGASHICVVRIDSAGERNSLERVLCRVLQPPVNKQLVT